MKINSTAWTIIGVLLVSAALIGVSLFMRGGPVTMNPDASVSEILADDYVKGAVSSPVVVTEYLDFECPSCAAYYPIVNLLQGEYGDRVTFVTRYFPLSGHVNGQSSAYAAEAAGRQGKFYEMEEMLFARQDQWGSKGMQTPEVFEGFAAELGLDVEKFKTDVKSDEVKARVARDKNVGTAAGIAGTPSFFVNGVKIQNPRTIEEFRAILDAELAKAPAAPVSE